MPGHRLIVLAAAVPGGMRKYRCHPSCGVATVSVSGQGCPYTRHSAREDGDPVRGAVVPVQVQADDAGGAAADADVRSVRPGAGQHLQVRDL
jgi:hypothetical protein